MFRIIAVLGVLAYIFSSPVAEARRGGGAIYSSGDGFELVHDLKPETAQAVRVPANVDLGYMHYQFKLFWMPFYGSNDGRYVLFTETSDAFEYYELDPEDIGIINRMEGTNFGKDYSISIFANYWGWLVALALIGLVVVFGRDGDEA